MPSGLQCDDGSPLNETEFGYIHRESDDSRQYDDTSSDQYSLKALEELRAEDGEPSFNEDRAERKTDSHDGSQPE